MRRHKKPRYLQNSPSYLVRIPWVATSGEPSSPQAYNNSAHAAIHSLLAALKCEDIGDVRQWLKQAKRQVNNAARKANKPTASVPVEGKLYR